MTLERQRYRTDHRTQPFGGPLGHYLLNDYLLKRDWNPDGPVMVPEQMHETARNASGYVHLEGGKPAMRRAWLNYLSGYPWQAMRLAIDMVRENDPEAVAVLEYYQLPESRRVSRYKFAFEQNCAESTLSDRFKRAIRKVSEHMGVAMEAWEGKREWPAEH